MNFASSVPSLNLSLLPPARNIKSLTRTPVNGTYIPYLHVPILYLNPKTLPPPPPPRPRRDLHPTTQTTHRLRRRIRRPRHSRPLRAHGPAALDDADRGAGVGGGMGV